MSKMFRTTKNEVGRGIVFWCPGCKMAHRIVVDSPDGWTWNEATLSMWPSLLVYDRKKFDETGKIVDLPRCHSFIRDGVWEFLGDCTHELAGQKVSMVPLPDWLSD